MGPEKNSSGWTDDRIERLKALYAEGLSCSQIAAELGLISRNAVIGKVHRLKLDRRGTNGNYKGNGRTRKPRPSRAKPRSESIHIIRSNILRWGQGRGSLVETEVFDPVLPVVIEPLNIPLIELTANQCRWIDGNGRSGMFCGHPVLNGISWCPAHRALVFTPRTESRRSIAPVLPTNLAKAGSGSVRKFAQ